MLVPDILANAGGVTTSYFEWVQDLQYFFWTTEEVNQRLHKIMSAAFERVYGLSVSNWIDMRTAANTIAIGEVAKAMQLRGLVP
jgi:glutamate dehydrogenase (NAD(P)+)